jgi:3-isopropylmalate/(R)-2-methylmalate dehydratase large subunit
MPMPYDDVVVKRCRHISPTVTWGITPGQGIGVDETVPNWTCRGERPGPGSLCLHGFAAGTADQRHAGDVCFIGSCTNGRISDLREAARVAQGHQVAPGVKAFVVPGSERVKQQAEAEGLHKVFDRGGFEWRQAGCSMCLAMNPDKLQGRQISASSSNRNFQGRQGRPQGAPC